MFATLATGAEAVLASTALVGLNLVAPEADPVALRDYWLHMQLFKFIANKFPDVAFALHAGELEQGLVSGCRVAQGDPCMHATFVPACVACCSPALATLCAGAGC